MGKAGRNDPCPCGSGLKYKKCCLEHDKQREQIRAVQSHSATSRDDLQLKIAEYDWSNPVYELVAQYFLDQVDELYLIGNVEKMIDFWFHYSSHERPQVRKAGVFVAAMEYILDQVTEVGQFRQTDLAAKYDVSAPAISQRFQDMARFIAEFGSGDMQKTPTLSEIAADEDMPVPPRRNVQALTHSSAEQFMRDIEKALASQTFESEEELDAFIRNTVNQPGELDKLMAMQPRTKKDEAEELLDRAFFETEDPGEKKRLARQALKIYPHHPDAYVIFAACAEYYDDALELFRKGIEAGERDLGSAFMQENRGHFWGMIETRPYMRARHGYAETLWALGRLPEASREFEEMLGLNPNDNQGVRHELATLYLELEAFDKAVDLIGRYDEDGSPFFLYTAVIAEFALSGKGKKLDRLLREAIASNEHVPYFLTGRKKLPEEKPEYISFGDEDEAVAYVQLSLPVWLRYPELLTMFKSKSRP